MDKLRSIDYFLKVAENGSIVAAAQVLEVTPSAVSKVIAALEAELGFSLLNRTTRRISLTADGAAYLECCRQILWQLDEVETERREQRGVPAGTVKVAMHPAFRNPFFADVTTLFKQHHGLRLETRITNSPTVLYDEGFDLMIRVGELSDSNVVARTIGSLEFVVGASPAYLAERGTPKSPRELEHHRWLLGGRIDEVLVASHHFEFVRDREHCAVTVSTSLRARDSIGLPESVVGGAGVACLYRVALMRQIAAGLVKPLLTDWTARPRNEVVYAGETSHVFKRLPVYAVFPNARAITPKVNVLVDLFAALVAESAKPFPGE